MNYIGRAGDKIDISLSQVPPELLSTIFKSVPAKSLGVVTQSDVDANASIADQKFNIDLKGLTEDKANEVLSKLGEKTVDIPKNRQ